MAIGRPTVPALVLVALLALAWPVVLAGSEHGDGDGVRPPSVPDRMLVPVWRVELAKALLRAEPVYTPGGYIVLFLDGTIVSLDAATGEVLGQRVFEEVIKPQELQVGVDQDGDYVAFADSMSDRVVVLSLPDLSFKVNAKPSEGTLAALLYLGDGFSIAAYNQDLVTRVVALKGNETLWVEELAGDYVLDSCRADGKLLLALASEVGDSASWVAIVEASLDGVKVLANETSTGLIYWYAGENGAGFSPDCRLLAVALEQDAGTLLRVFEVYGDGSWEHSIDGFLAAASEVPLTWSTNGSYLAIPLVEDRLDYRVARLLFMPRPLLTGGSGEPVEYTIPPDEDTFIYRLYAVYDTSMGPLAVLMYAPRFAEVNRMALVPVGWGEPIVEDDVPIYGYSPSSGTLYLAFWAAGEIPVLTAYRLGDKGLERVADYPTLIAAVPEYVVPVPSGDGDRLVFAGHTSLADSGESAAIIALMDWRDVVRVYESDSIVITMYPMSEWWSYNKTLEASGPGYSVTVSVSVKLRKGAGYWYSLSDNGTAELVAGSYGAVAIVDVKITRAQGIYTLDLTIVDKGRRNLLSALVEGSGLHAYEIRPYADKYTLADHDLEGKRFRIVSLLTRLDPNEISPGDQPLDFELSVTPKPGGGITTTTTAGPQTNSQTAGEAGEGGEGGGAAAGGTASIGAGETGATGTAEAGGAGKTAAIVIVVLAVAAAAAAMLLRR